MLGARKIPPKLIILGAVCLLFTIAFSYLLSTNQGVLGRSDLMTRWYATNKLVTEHRSLYDLQNAIEAYALHSITGNPIEGGFFYPAYLIVFTLPLTWLSYPLAHFIWVILIQLFLIAGVWMVFREKGWPRSSNQFTVFLLLSILFIPNMQNTIWGQFNTIAVISLSLVYVCLLRGNYFLAGLFATGMTFKPQEMLLTLVFFLVWAIFQKTRWKFILGFVLGMLALSLFASLFEPGWVNTFISSLQSYSTDLRPQPVFHLPGIYGWALVVIAASFVLWIIVRNRACPASGDPFAGCVILSLGVWWLFVPVFGMMHLVALPIAALLLFAGLRKNNPVLYRYGIPGILVLYGLGLLGFLYGLSSPILYGTHIQLAELGYKVVLPVIMTVMAAPLYLTGKDRLDENAYQLDPELNSEE